MEGTYITVHEHTLIKGSCNWYMYSCSIKGRDWLATAGVETD